MEHLCHGSAIAGIGALEPRSKLHGTQRNVVYLTDNLPCALFYIWDGARIGCGEKHVTGGIRNGIAFYEEQFPNQLEAFYGGTSGYLYRVAMSPDIRPLSGREGLYYTEERVVPAKIEYISNVYEELFRYETLGKLEIRRYKEQTPARQKELTEMIAAVIVQEGFCRDNPVRAAFLQKYFSAAWETALKNA